jgi:hypothetical protein
MPARKPPPSKSFAALLKDTRGDAKQQVVAHAAGCSPQNIGMVERAQQHPSREIISAYLQLTERRNDMERRNAIMAAAAGLGLLAVPEQALAHAWDTAPAASAWPDTVMQRGAELITQSPMSMQQALGADIAQVSAAGRGAHLSRAGAQLAFFYARTLTETEQAARWYERAVQRAQEAEDAPAVAWTQGCVALARSHDRRWDTDTRRRAEHALTLAGGDRLSTVGAVKANLAAMHVALAAGDTATADTHRDAALRASERLEPVPGGNAVFFNPEALMASLAYGEAKRGNVIETEEWAAQARQTGDGGRNNEHLDLYEAVARNNSGDPDAADTARAVMRALGDAGATGAFRALAAEAGASEYAA